LHVDVADATGRRLGVLGMAEEGEFDTPGASLPEGIEVDEAAAYFGITDSSDVIVRLSQSDRLNGLGEFLALTVDLVLKDEFDFQSAAARLGCEDGEVYYLLSGPFGLLTMTDPLRRYLGQADSEGETGPHPGIPESEIAALDQLNDIMVLMRMVAIAHLVGGLRLLDHTLVTFEAWVLTPGAHKQQLLALSVITLSMRRRPAPSARCTASVFPAPHLLRNRHLRPPPLHLLRNRSHNPHRRLRLFTPPSSPTSSRNRRRPLLLCNQPCRLNLHLCNQSYRLSRIRLSPHHHRSRCPNPLLRLPPHHRSRCPNPLRITAADVQTRSCACPRITAADIQTRSCACPRITTAAGNHGNVGAGTLAESDGRTGT